MNNLSSYNFILIVSLSECPMFYSSAFDFRSLHTVDGCPFVIFHEMNEKSVKKDVP